MKSLKNIQDLIHLHSQSNYVPKFERTVNYQCICDVPFLEKSRQYVLIRFLHKNLNDVV